MTRLISVVCLLCASFPAWTDGWQGNWHRNSLLESAEMIISNVTKDSFHFTVTAFFGAHTGEMEGDAVITGQTAYSLLEDDDIPREARFVLTNEGITLTTVNCEGYYGGVGVVFDGVFISDILGADSMALARLEEILGNKAMAAKIKKGMGPAFVDMTYCLHVVSEEKCLDSFAATVFVGNVMGVGPEMAAILMVTKNNQFYTAWYDGEKLFYMASDSRYKKKLPKTVSEWVKQYEGVKVEFR
jgi:hypothetical protein